MDQKIINLDDNVSEYIEFTLKGHKYKFRQLTTEEIDAFQNVKGSDKESREYLYQFVSPVDEGTPPFEELAPKMLLQHWKNFLKMVTSVVDGNS